MAQVATPTAFVAGLAAIVMMSTNPAYNPHDLYNPPAIIRKSQQGNTEYGLGGLVFYLSAFTAAYNWTRRRP